MQKPVFLRLEKSLARWCIEAGGKYTRGLMLDDRNTLDSSTYNKLKAYGFNKETIISIMAFYGAEVEHAYAFVDHLRILAWFWPNGEEIIFPVNSAGSVYIGNSPYFWFDHYPFLRRLSGSSHRYECHLPILEGIWTDCTDRNRFYLGGQTHFGHFAIDKFCPILTILPLLLHNEINISSVLVPSHEGITRELLDLCVGHFDTGKAKQFYSWIPPKHGLYSIGPAIIPADNHSPESISIANKYIYSKIQATKPINLAPIAKRTNRICYISRFPAYNTYKHDRISNYSQMKELFASCGVDHVYPTELTLQERSDIISSYDLIISDSGSCAINGLLFSIPSTPVVMLQSARLMKDRSELACSQHYKSLPLIGSKLFSLVCQSQELSDSNSWYDKVEVNLEQLKLILESQSNLYFEMDGNASHTINHSD